MWRENQDKSPVGKREASIQYLAFPVHSKHHIHLIGISNFFLVWMEERVWVERVGSEVPGTNCCQIVRVLLGL